MGSKFSLAVGGTHLCCFAVLALAVVGAVLVVGSVTTSPAATGALSELLREVGVSTQSGFSGCATFAVACLADEGRVGTNLLWNEITPKIINFTGGVLRPINTQTHKIITHLKQVCDS